MKMKVHFSIPFNTTYGQQMIIRGSVDELNQNFVSGSNKIYYTNGVWHFEVNIANCNNFTYSYVLIEESGELIFEAGAPRLFSISSGESYRVYDQWREYNDEAPFLSDAYKKVFFNRNKKKLNLTRNFKMSLSANNIPSNSYIV